MKLNDNLTRSSAKLNDNLQGVTSENLAKEPESKPIALG